MAIQTSVKCGICHETAHEEESLTWSVLLTCGHVFHSHCLEQALQCQRPSVCPFCRVSLKGQIPPAFWTSRFNIMGWLSGSCHGLGLCVGMTSQQVPGCNVPGWSGTSVVLVYAKTSAALDSERRKAKRRGALQEPPQQWKDTKTKGKGIVHRPIFLPLDCQAYCGSPDAHTPGAHTPSSRPRISAEDFRSQVQKARTYLYCIWTDACLPRRLSGIPGCMLQADLMWQQHYSMHKAESDSLHELGMWSGTTSTFTRSQCSHR